MSLINDALKRAEADKRNNAVPTGDGLLKPVHNTGRRRFDPVVVFVLAVIVAMAGAATGAALVGSRAPKVPAEAAASVTIEAPQPDRAAAALCGAELAISKTIQNVPCYMVPESRPAVEVKEVKKDAPVQQAAIRLAPAAPSKTTPAIETRPADFASQQPASHPASQPTTQRASLAADVKAAPDSQPASMPSADEVRRSYRLSAIMRGPQGATAIINGKFVRVGASVDGANLVDLGTHTAELEINGQRFTIRM
jgi:hypothetical protein